MTIPKKPILNYRQKTLLGLLQALGGSVPPMDFQKYLFLFSKEFEKKPSFDFVPYHYGCFSFQSYADKRRLVDMGILSDKNDWCLNEPRDNQDLFDHTPFNYFYKRYAHLKGDQLVQNVYRRYPYYAIKSYIARNLMNDHEMVAIEEERPTEKDTRLFTIGYEGRSLDLYLNLLIKNNVNTLVDVRRNPLSRKYGFSKKTLSSTIEKLGMKYIHMPQLGISSDQRRELNVQSDYDRLFDSYEKNELSDNRSSLMKLFEVITDRKRVAITCFESHVCMCHRGRIAKTLELLPEWSYAVRHI